MLRDVHALANQTLKLGTLLPFQVLTVYMQSVAHLHLVCQAIVHNKTVRHLHSMRFHGVPCPIVVVSYLWIIEVSHLPGSHIIIT